MQIRFYSEAEDDRLEFSVILARSAGKWVLCRHRDRTTWEVPGGHREAGETAEQAARRELYEETGALEYELEPLCVYSVTGPAKRETFGMLYTAEIRRFEKELCHEIGEIALVSEPDGITWTYPLIQPELIREYIRRREARGGGEPPQFAAQGSTTSGLL